jgi:putative peptide-modifying radical SAM enzyme
MPSDITYDLSSLRCLVEKNPHAVVAFYGGEPLLRYEKIKLLLDELPAEHFVINTNGYYIESIKDMLQRFDTILLSIDGRKQVTDYYRQDGSYDQVITAVNIIKQSSFSGELIARMAVSKKTDIYSDVMHLLDHFPYVHWQLDVVWSALWDLHAFNHWVDSSYISGLDRLVSWWISEIRKDQIHGIVPFLGIMTRILHEGGGLPCEAGEEAIAITTDGTIMACPIAPDYQWNTLGSLSEGFQRIKVDQPCPSCDIYGICGGRCLFTNKERLWGQQGFHAICSVTKHLVSQLQGYVSVCEPIKEKFQYPPFNNTTEIIP